MSGSSAVTEADRCHLFPISGLSANWLWSTGNTALVPMDGHTRRSRYLPRVRDVTARTYSKLQRQFFYALAVSTSRDAAKSATEPSRKNHKRIVN